MKGKYKNENNRKDDSIKVFKRLYVNKKIWP